MIEIEKVEGGLNYFEELFAVNVNGRTEKKGNLTYLSWAFAWAEVKKRHPDATYTIYENNDEWNYFTDGRTGWVKTGVTVDGIEHIEYLPIMDFKNKSIPLENITSMDVNKAIQRSLTKACARHGLGLYIYAGEDLPESEQKDIESDLQKNISEKDVAILNNMLTDEQAAWVLEQMHISDLSQLTNEQFAKLMFALQEKEKQRNGKQRTA